MLSGTTGSIGVLCRSSKSDHDKYVSSNSMNTSVFGTPTNFDRNVGVIISRIRHQITQRIFLPLKDNIMNTIAKSNKNNAAAGPVDVSSKLINLSPKVALGAGCYWGTEKYIRHNFQQMFPNSIQSCAVGFMAPSDVTNAIKNPNYKQVCTGKSGHVEVLFVELNEPEKHFEELIRYFFQFHDPTTLNRHGNDAGFQYASFIFCGDQQQMKIAERVRSELQNALDHKIVLSYSGDNVTTKITELTEFTKAHEEHQRYLEMNPYGYCNHRLRFKEWPVVNVM